MIAMTLWIWEISRADGIAAGEKESAEKIPVRRCGRCSSEVPFSHQTLFAERRGAARGNRRLWAVRRDNYATQGRNPPLINLLNPPPLKHFCKTSSQRKKKVLHRTYERKAGIAFRFRFVDVPLISRFNRRYWSLERYALEGPATRSGLVVVGD